MPNLTGGKKYKRTKHNEGPSFIEKMSDQLYARVLKNLGDRNILAYCNDNKIRLCHIRGSIRKDMWINTGDIILVSIRDELKQTEIYQRGDVLHKYSTDHYSKLKSDISINIRLFTALERQTPEDLKKMEGSGLVTDGTEDLFDYDITNDDVDAI